MGMELDKGYISHYMVTDRARLEAECKDVKILVTDMKVTSIESMIPILDQVANSGKRELVIIAEDITGDALQNFIMNTIN
jgi:chaperonin GroEL